jgi:acetolactate synthase-1/2/3 large subunit
VANLQEKETGLPDQATLERWWQQIDEWRGKHGLWTGRRYGESKQIMPQQVIESLYRVTNGDAYVTSDVGQHQMFAAQYYRFDQPRRWINSGGLGTMGFGLPAAMGVQLAFPDMAVACVTGEGSIQMNIRSCPPVPSTTPRSRSSTCATTTWAWSSSGRTCSTRGATP